MKPSNPSAGEQIIDVRFSEDSLIVDLADGRTLTVPLAWFPRLAGASRSELDNWQISAAGFGIHWPELDEDLSAEGLLRGAPAPYGSVPTEG
jgi:hypothetical protein